MIELSPNHRRSISITLQLVDKALCEWADWSRGRTRRGVMYSEEDNLSPEAKNQLREQIAAIRDVIVGMQDELGLESMVIQTGHSMHAASSILWENLAELNSGALSGYGGVPDATASYINKKGEELASLMSALGRSVGGAT